MSRRNGWLVDPEPAVTMVVIDLYGSPNSVRLGLSWRPVSKALVALVARGEIGVSMMMFEHNTAVGSVPSGKGSVGAHRRIAEIDRLINDRDRIQLAGDYFNAPTQNNSVVDTGSSRLPSCRLHPTGDGREKRKRLPVIRVHPRNPRQMLLSGSTRMIGKRPPKGRSRSPVMSCPTGG